MNNPIHQELFLKGDYFDVLCDERLKNYPPQSTKRGSNEKVKAKVFSSCLGRISVYCS